VFAGHAALALFAKSRAPRIPIALLVPVAFAPDWIELIGEAFHQYNRELSHSIVSVGIGATVVALAYAAVVILRERSDQTIATESGRSFASLRMTGGSLRMTGGSLGMTGGSLGMTTLVLWLTYVSHWPADFITGIKPTWPGGPTVGLLLYAHPLGDILVECALIVVCWLAYTRSLPTVSRKRAINFLIPLGLIGMQIVFEAIQSPDFG
jgi:hypothetical protein